MENTILTEVAVKSQRTLDILKKEVNRPFINKVSYEGLDRYNVDFNYKKQLDDNVWMLNSKFFLLLEGNVLEAKSSLPKSFPVHSPAALKNAATAVALAPANTLVTKSAPNPKTLAGLTQIARDFLQQEYGLDLIIPIVRNSRLQRALGRFKYRHSSTLRQPVVVELSGKLLDYYTAEETVDVLKHELIHYACFMLKKPHHDGDAHFENELKRLGVTRTGVLSRKGKVHQYTCTGCGKQSQFSKKFNVNLYQSKCCKAPFEYKGETVVQ